MSTLRDARLEKALAHAPDAAEGAPAAAVRDAIREAAHRAVAPSPRQPWWRWPAPGAPRGPWNAAFATLLLAGVVTLLWRGGDELPQGAADRAAPAESRQPGPPAGGVAPPDPAASAAAPSAGAPTTPPRPPEVVAVPAPQHTPAPTPMAKPAESRRAGDAASPAAAESARSDARSAAAAAQKAAGEPGEAAQRKESSAAALPVTPSAPMAAREPAAGRAASADVATPAPAPAPAAPPAAPTANTTRDAAFPQRGEAAPAPSVAQLPARAPDWDAVRIDAQGSAREVPRSQAAELAATVADLLASRGATARPAREGLPLQLTLSQGGRTVGQLAVGENEVTWQPAGEPAVAWQVDAARLAALRAQALQLLTR